MAINKVVYGNDTLIDITDTTASAGDVLNGQVFYAANGTRTVGTGATTDVQINGTSITSNSVANIVTNTAYNASSNKIATMSDVNTKVDTTKTARAGSTTYTGSISNPGYAVYLIANDSNDDGYMLSVDASTGVSVSDYDGNPTQIHHLATPTKNSDAANKDYVDSSIPTKTSDLTNDSNFITGMFIASYGSSTYAEVLDAYQKNKVIYCRASSNSNPATGNQLRMAFLAYVNNQTTPTEFEFQYYRSVSTHSASQQGDQVFVYKLNSSGTWSVTTREAYTKIVAGTGLSSSYSSGTLTLTSSGGSSTDVQINGTSIVSSGTANIVTNTAYNASSNKIATMSDISSSLGSYVEKSSSSQNESGLTGWDYDGGLIYETRLQGNYGDGYVTIYPNEVEIGSANSFVSLNDGSCSLGGSSGITLNNDTYIYGGLIAGTTGDGDVTLHGLVAPTANDDPATKKYVDDICGNIETLLGGI